MTAMLANHLWQSTLFAVAVAIFTFTFRRHRANVRFHLWLCASVKFLVPFALLVDLGVSVGFRPAARIAAPLSVSPALVEIGQPFRDRGFVPVTSSVTQTRDRLPIAVIGIWA